MQKLTSFSKYLQLVPAAQRKENEKFAKFSKFRARFNMAAGLESISIPNLASSTQDAYAVALKVTLAFTALEALEDAIGCKHQIKIADPDLAYEFRSRENAKFIEAIGNSLEGRRSEDCRKTWNAFQSEKSDDLRPIVYAIRNLMAHGKLTAENLNLPPSKYRRRLLEDLAELTLLKCDERFTQYVQRMRRS